MRTAAGMQKQEDSTCDLHKSVFILTLIHGNDLRTADEPNVPLNAKRNKGRQQTIATLNHDSNEMFSLRAQPLNL